MSVGAGVALEAGRWYRLMCVRDGATLLVTVTSWTNGGAASTQSWSKSGATGDLTPASTSTPVAVGARVANAAVDSSPDQFNGKVDNVVVSIG